MASHSDRREQFLSPSPSRRRVSPNVVIAAAAVVFLGAIAFVTSSNEAPEAAAERASFRSGHDVTLAVSDFEDGRARFYRYVGAAGTEIRFFVMKSSDGVVRAAFDTCDVCFRERKGYRQAGDSMICNNCEQAFASNQINVLRGGCNPAPIERSVEGDRVVLRAAALEQGASYF